MLQGFATDLHWDMFTLFSLNFVETYSHLCSHFSSVTLVATAVKKRIRMLPHPAFSTYLKTIAEGTLL